MKSFNPYPPNQNSIWRRKSASLVAYGRHHCLLTPGPDLDLDITPGILNLDVREALMALGAAPITSETYRVRSGRAHLDKIASHLSRRFHAVWLRAPRGGIHLFTGQADLASSPAFTHGTAARIDLQHLLQTTRGSAMDVLVLNPSRGKAQFVAAQVAMPDGVGWSRMSHVLTRVRDQSGEWRYVAIETTTGLPVSMQAVGSTPAWRLRILVEDALLRSEAITFTSSAGRPRPTRVRRRHATIAVQRQLDAAGLSAVKVLERRYGLQQPQLMTGRSGRHLAMLADRLYGLNNTGAAGTHCLIIDDTSADPAVVGQVMGLLQSHAETDPWADTDLQPAGEEWR